MSGGLPVRHLVPDEHGVVTLDGHWDFHPGDTSIDHLEECQWAAITVPALWEAEGHLELDGPAWYRTRFRIDDVDQWWSLRFGAVMDLSDVWLNGRHLGAHDNPFTPFILDATLALRAGENELAVRVVDPRVDDPEHVQLPHGKQGWANWVFPSRPSLYMTYGGIWQPVALHRHGPVRVRDVFVNGDPSDLQVRVTLEDRSGRDNRAVLGVRAVGAACESVIDIRAGSTVEHVARFGATTAARWRPAEPILHTALIDVQVDDRPSDATSARFGLRTIRIDGTRILVDDEPYRMRSALVQGFRADTLYAEGDRAAIEEEVRAAAAMGFNTLRLHIKAFDPTYLDVCDELGMFVHCDIPVAEPIAHAELGAEGESAIATRSVEAVRQQISRDRNHPSIILWSVMNELCLDAIEFRASAGYERFARALVATAKECDPTRPVIENDWVEPDPGRVFAGDVLTAHWYGRLHADYLDKIEQSCEQWRDVERPLYVTEFGDWGLPDMPSLPEAPFWDPREIYAAGLAGTLWPASIGRFVTETQRYQGLSDRLQAEVFRRHDHIGGYCLTELTDVPHELNGLLDLHRRPKSLAVREVARANQVVLPMLRLDGLVVVAGSMVAAPLFVANDGPALDAVEIEVRFGAPPLSMERLLELDTSGMSAADVLARFDESAWAMPIGRIDAHCAAEVGSVALRAPDVCGAHDLVVLLRSDGGLVAENRYPIHVVAAPSAAGGAVRLAGNALSGGLGSSAAGALERIGAKVGDDGPTVVAEGGLDASLGIELRQRLAAGETVLVLAQPVENAGHYPAPVELVAVETEWGSSVFHFTTNHGGIPSFPRRNVLVAEDSTIQARSVVARIGGEPFPDTPVVIAYKPVPGAMTGTVLGSAAVGDGRLLFCQYRLCERAVKGDAAAMALLADLVAWATAGRRGLDVERSTLADGRAVARYRHVRRAGL